MEELRERAGKEALEHTAEVRTAEAQGGVRGACVRAAAVARVSWEVAEAISGETLASPRRSVGTTAGGRASARPSQPARRSRLARDAFERRESRCAVGLREAWTRGGMVAEDGGGIGERRRKNCLRSKEKLTCGTPTSLGG